MSFAIIILIIVVLLTAVALFMFWRTRKLLRDAKNYERGLKMVPMLVHLPPPSDDAETGGRDVRDVADENISKAQILYNIIASTAQKGFKSRFYGQRHISFEIVSHRGLVYFYLAVPVALVSVVEQAILSAYPHCRLEEVAEHNIFNPIGKISGTMGGELVLKSSYSFPIATFQDLKRDSMQSLLNSLSKLEKQDGAGIQILIRPAADHWAKVAASEATKLREGKKKKKGLELIFWWSKQLFIAPFKPPEVKSDKLAVPDKTGTNLEQSIADSIEEKTRHAGYEVLIRVVASSNIAQRAQAIMGNIVATFSLFDAPGKNGFKFLPAKDVESFVTAYIMRFFPPEQNRTILNSIELSSIFHFPDGSGMPTSQLERQASKQVDGPRSLLDEGLLLGYNVFRNTKKSIRLGEKDRRRHMYVVGQTGTGKSVFLENMALQDMLEGRGFAFVDPHGDSAERLLGMVPKERTEDVIYFCPADMDYPMGLNLFEFQSPEQKDFLIQEAISMLYKLYDPQHQGIIGPRYEHWFRNAALTLMSDPSGSTFIDIPKVFTDNNYAKQKLKYVTDQIVLDFWNKEMASTSDYHKSEVLGWFVSKFGAFLSNEMMRNIIGQTKSSFDLRDIMDNGKILLVNLSKGRTGELNSKLLGMIFVMKFQAAAMSRANVPEDQRRDFCLYVDEFQNFSTDSFATILSEARKYRLNLVVANQFITQLSEEVRDAVFGNIGTVIAHRVGTADAEALEKYFRPVFDIDDLQRLPTANSIVRMLIGGVPTQPFSMADLPILGNSNHQLAEALKQLSAAKFGRPRLIVEAEIFKRLATEEPVKTVFSGSSSDNLPGQAKMPVSSTQSSFLDEWLAKRRSSSSQNPQNPFPTPGKELADSQPDKPLTASPSNSVISSSAKEARVHTTTPILDRDNGQNISSNAIDDDEVDDIANQLKRGFEAQPNATGIVDKTADNVLHHNDTISIDKDGNLRYRDQSTG